MAIPYDAAPEAIVAGTTTVKKTWGDSVWTWINAIYSGTQRVRKMEVGADGVSTVASAGQIYADGMIRSGTSCRALKLISDNASQGIELQDGNTGIVNMYIRSARGQTTDGTALQFMSFTTPTDSITHISARISGIKSNNTDCGTYWATYAVKNIAGVLTNVGAQQSIETARKDDAGWGGISFNISSAPTVTVTIAGKAATTINWVGVVEIINYDN